MNEELFERKENLNENSTDDNQLNEELFERKENLNENETDDNQLNEELFEEEEFTIMPCCHENLVFFKLKDILNQIFDNNKNPSIESLENLFLNLAILPIETLQFIKDEKMKDYFSSNEAIKNSIFELIDHEDYRIKSLSIFVASQISPDKFLSEINLKKLFHLLSSDSYSKVKVCILRCFYNFFDDFSRINFEEKLLNCDALNVFNLLLHNNSIHRIQIETVKIISKLAQFKSLKLKKTVKPYLTLFVNQNDTWRRFNQ